jgi:hypothetical protein
MQQKINSKLTQLPYIYNLECFYKRIWNLDLESIGEDHTIDFAKNSTY